MKEKTDKNYYSGEKIDDLQEFDPEQFVLGLFGDVFEDKNEEALTEKEDTNEDLA